MLANKRMFDRSSYSARTLSVFQLVGAYIVDIYYNHLYAEAIKFKNDGKVHSITEGYRHAAFAFVSAIDTKAKANYKAEYYTKLLQGINEYFICWTSFNSLTLSECIDKIVKEFVPDDYYNTLDKDQKRNILRIIITNTIREFTKVVISEYLANIIDNHEDVANVEALKEGVINIFIGERESMFHKFLDSRSNNPSEEKVDKKFAEKMRTEIMRLTEVNNVQAKNISGLNEQLSSRTEQLSKVINKYRKLENAYNLIVAEHKVSKEKIGELEEQLSNVSAPIYNTGYKSRPGVGGGVGGSSLGGSNVGVIGSSVGGSSLGVIGGLGGSGVGVIGGLGGSSVGNESARPKVSNQVMENIKMRKMLNSARGGGSNTNTSFNAKSQIEYDAEDVGNAEDIGNVEDSENDSNADDAVDSDVATKDIMFPSKKEMDKKLLAHTVTQQANKNISRNQVGNSNIKVSAPLKTDVNKTDVNKTDVNKTDVNKTDNPTTTLLQSSNLPTSKLSVSKLSASKSLSSKPPASKSTTGKMNTKNIDDNTDDNNKNNAKTSKAESIVIKSENNESDESEQEENNSDIITDKFKDHNNRKNEMLGNAPKLSDIY